MAGLAVPEFYKLWSLARANKQQPYAAAALPTMGEPQPLDAQSTKLVLIALLRAVSRMKGVLEEPDRARGGEVVLVDCRAAFTVNGWTTRERAAA